MLSHSAQIRCVSALYCTSMTWPMPVSTTATRWKRVVGVERVGVQLAVVLERREVQPGAVLRVVDRLVRRAGRLVDEPVGRQVAVGHEGDAFEPEVRLVLVAGVQLGELRGQVPLVGRDELRARLRRVEAQDRVERDGVGRVVALGGDVERAVRRRRSGPRSRAGSSPGRCCRGRRSPCPRPSRCWCRRPRGRPASPGGRPSSCS